MPEECKGKDTVLAYQKYYIVEKSDFATWKRREIPTWWTISQEDLNLQAKTMKI